ncbi:uncharacterized protein L969DRAFT_45281 [Mixia osmundae IAM 14324]|uniref:Uncharacterized protein n=1 Tax=Mixia osmundae (strain CBS 9802 / IAM 14324 / JCM 22182 / KY 12970) TaxID=764103 RepID=G7DXA2_MIXOS|nr:uncharacterized protein L969DRAFT_45281 [Mixia osmundae IAM 14324]KEI41294.1 hypothetical protein L969DRAFT_45281 [Mixia osmundae IAM 14324]GAA95212.1 hypothetical protein E5Q_01868 [Mixia osmundae IAM 14324]
MQIQGPAPLPARQENLERHSVMLYLCVVLWLSVYVARTVSQLQYNFQNYYVRFYETAQCPWIVQPVTTGSLTFTIAADLRSVNFYYTDIPASVTLDLRSHQLQDDTYVVDLGVKWPPPMYAACCKAHFNAVISIKVTRWEAEWSQAPFDAFRLVCGPWSRACAAQFPEEQSFRCAISSESHRSKYSTTRVTRLITVYCPKDLRSLHIAFVPSAYYLRVTATLHSDRKPA